MIYLDNAATSHPKPGTVLSAMTGVLKRANANPGRSGHDVSLAAGRVLLAARRELATMLGASDPMAFVFTYNCTDALNTAIKGVIAQGGHAVTTGVEHNSVIRVLKTLENAGVIELTIVEPDENGAVDAGAFLSAVRPDTRLAVMTCASNVTGVVQPYEAVAAALRGGATLFLLDAAQVAGILPLDITAMGVDMVAMPGHKGLLGPQGTGALYVRPGLEITPLREGGTGSSSELLLQPSEMPERLESGTLNTPGVAGLFAGVRYVRFHFDEMRAHERALTALLLNGLLSTPFVTVYGSTDARDRVGVVSFNIADLPAGGVADALNSAGICVRAGLHCAPLTHIGLGTLDRGAVRASIGSFNTQDDVYALLDVVGALARAVRV